MDGIYRGGNTRLLAKTLDQSLWPIAVLNHEGEIIYVNSALCEVAETESTRLVGQHCCWQVASDDLPFGQLLSVLAPPPKVFEGASSFRAIPWPPVKPTRQIGQYFIPLTVDSLSEPGQSTFLVLFREIVEADSSADTIGRSRSLQQTQADELLLRLRSQWTHLDGLSPLLGSSTAIQAAMQRVQLAIKTSANVFVWGPRGVGKSEVLRAIFSCRLRHQSVPLISGQMLPLDCALLDEPLLEAMLEVFLSRLRSEVPAIAQQLTLERIDRLPIGAAATLNSWLDENESKCCIGASSQVAQPALSERGESWGRLLSRIGTIDAQLPPLSSRREDIPVLLQQSLATASARASRPPPIISQLASELLCSYSWPENHAELQHCMTELLPLVVMTATIQPNHLPLAIRTFSNSATSSPASTFEPVKLDEVLIDIERIMIERALKLSPRNRAQAARWLGISRPRLLRRIAELGLDDPTIADDPDAAIGE